MSEENAPETEGQVSNDTPESEGQAWYSGVDEETVGYIQNKGWDDPVKAVNSYKELEKFRGANEDELLFLPKDPDAEGAYDDIYAKLGRPETAEAYKIEGAEGLDEGRLNLAREIAHKNGLNDKALNDFIKADVEYAQKYQEELEVELAKQQGIEVDQLKKDWGKGYEEKAELGRRFIRDNMPKGVDSEAMLSAIERAIGTGLTLRLFGNAGEKAGREDSSPDSSGDKPFGYTREQAVADKKTLIDEISADPVRLDNYNKGIGPDIEKINKLQKIMSPK